jgi:hypothetical protein
MFKKAIMTEPQQRREYQRNWEKANPDKVKEYGRRNRAKYPEMWRLKGMNQKRRNLDYCLWLKARDRAKEFNLPFTISREDVCIPEKCPLLEIPLFRAGQKPTPNSPTLDRIIPTLGYVKGNIQVISFKANTMKSNATLEEMELLVKNWKRRNCFN